MQRSGVTSTTQYRPALKQNKEKLQNNVLFHDLDPSIEIWSSDRYRFTLSEGDLPLIKKKNKKEMKQKLRSFFKVFYTRYFDHILSGSTLPRSSLPPYLPQCHVLFLS